MGINYEYEQNKTPLHRRRYRRTLQPRRILHAPGAISIHGGFLPGKPRILVFGTFESVIQDPVFMIGKHSIEYGFVW